MKRVLLALIRFYRRELSPRKGKPCCRYFPTCSQYAVTAIERYGAIKGGRLAAWRILRCNPLGGQGFDPVPPKGQFRLPHYWQGRKGHF